MKHGMMLKEGHEWGERMGITMKIQPSNNNNMKRFILKWGYWFKIQVSWRKFSSLIDVLILVVFGNLQVQEF